MPRSIAAVVFVVGLLGARVAAPEEDGSISVPLHWTRGDPGAYEVDALDLLPKAPAGLTPPRAAKDARFARVELSSGRHLDIVFTPWARPMRIWVDSDLDGDLEDETPAEFAGDEYRTSAEVVIGLPAADGAPEVRIPLRFHAFTWRSGAVLKMAVLAHLEGEVVLEGRLRRVAAWDGDADLAFGSPVSDVLVLDLDGDREVSRKGGFERILEDRPFRVGSRGYRAEFVDGSPPHVRIRPTAKVPPPSPREWTGETREVPGRKRARTNDLTPDRIAKLWKEAEAEDRTWGSGSTFHREYAIDDLVAAGSREAFLMLLRIARTEKEEELRIAAVKGMGFVVFAPHAGRVVEIATKAREPSIRIAALRALHDMAAPERVEGYEDALGTEKDDDVAAAAARHLAFVGTPAAREALLRVLTKGRRKENRYHAYFALTRYATEPPPASRVRAALDQDEPRLRAIGLTDALFLGFTDCRERALALAKKAGKSPDLAAAVVEVLGREADVEAADAILALVPEMSAPARRRAVRLMGAIRDPGVVERLVAALGDGSPAVRCLVAETLGGIPGPGVADALAERLAHETDDDAVLALITALADHGAGAADRIVSAAGRIEKDPERLAATLKALGRVGLDHAPVRRFFEDCAASKSFETRILAIDAAAATLDPKAAPFLIGLIEDGTWQVRLAAVQGLGLARAKGSVPVLIDRLGEEDKGRVRSAIAETLFRITGQNFYEIEDLWRKWWKAEGESFEVPDAIPTLPATSHGTGFYGVPVDSDRIIFVLDQSGSMDSSVSSLFGEKDDAAASKTDFERAVEETLGVVKTLDADARVNVILFESSVHPWQRRLVKMTKTAKAALERYLRSRRPTGTTNLYDALEMALLTKGVDTIYLLSDGGPTDGKYVADDDILAAVEKLNRTRRIAIHCIALGFDAGLLRELAAKNGGKYVRR